MKKGICTAGNLIVDLLYPVGRYPKPGELATICGEISRSTGGAACNVGMDLARLDGNLSVSVAGIVGADTHGDFILESLGAYGNIDCSGVKREGATSFSAVVSDAATKQRTFFHYRGANALFDESCLDWASLPVSILHVGYILLLDALDRPDELYGTKMAALLHHAQDRGVETSIDVVSENGGRFEAMVPPALKYADYCVINELEAQRTTGVNLSDPSLFERNMPRALEIMKKLGVKKWAAIHCPQAAYGMDERGECVEVESLKLDKSEIAGTVGAGDAFCAGVLYGAHMGAGLKEALTLGTACAACSLSAAGASEGVKSAEECMEFYHKRTAKAK